VEDGKLLPHDPPHDEEWLAPSCAGSRRRPRAARRGGQQVDIVYEEALAISVQPMK
jgi:hypothetical protein